MAHALDITPDDRLLRLPDVCATVGVGTTKIYAMIKDGQFPAPVKLGRASRWRQSEITGWIQRQ